MPEEKIVYKATLHWIIFMPGLLLTILGGVVGFNSYTILGSLFGSSFAFYLGRPLAGGALFIIIIGVVLLSGSYLRQTTTELVITNRRIIAKYGLISYSTFEIMINRITGSNFDQSVWGRLFDFGTVLVHGAGGDISPIDQIAEPRKFHQALMMVLERNH